MTRVAAIDCGTNTIRLLIAEADRDDFGRPRLEVLRRRNEIVRLGQGVDRTGLLDPEALERTLAAVASYAADCAELGVAPGGDVRRFVATSATRDARNREDFVAGVSRLLGIEPEVVSGQEEARLSFTGSLLGAGEDEGASGPGEHAPAPRLVVDLGGGSTELVLGVDEPSAAISLDTGSVRITERFLAGGVTPEVEAAAQVLECLRGLGEAIDTTDGANAGSPVLLTCRTAAEGGRAQLDDAAYGALLRSVLDGLTDWAPERRPAAIDVEVQRGCLPQVCTQAHGLGVDVVASFHDFEATPADEALEEVLARMAREGADLAKIAVWPTSADDVARLLGVCARATAGAGERSGLGVPVAAMSMGALGAVSRVAPAFGSALTFAVVPDEQGQARASAPGQLPIQDVRRCMELLRV